jgi:integrase
MIELTSDWVKNRTAPGIIWDGHDKAPTGFGLRIHKSGTKSFFLNYRIEGKERRHTIGKWPTWTVQVARAEAKRLREEEIDRGHDPARDKREHRNAPTVQDLINRYIKEHLPTKTAKGEGRAKDEKKMLEEIGKLLGKDRKVADIDNVDAEAMHKSITDSGRPVRANRVAAVARKMFSLALRRRVNEDRPWRDATQGNPFRGLERNTEEARERFFSQNELAAISEALAKYPGVAADCVRLIMLTGCRPAEAMNAQWTEFDKEPGYWIKPSAHTKQRRVHKLPLSPPAIELVDRLRKKQKGEWVFPGDKPGKPLAALWHVWHFVRKETGLGQDARVYDLRHTFASVGAGGGLSLPIIGKLLGHTQSRTTQRYAHLADDPVREAAEKITNVITNAGKPGAPAVPIRGQS